MFKFIGFVCIVFCGAIIGKIMSDHLRTMREACHELNSMFIQISNLIRYRNLNLYEIVRELHNSENYVHLDFLKHLPESYSPEVDFNDLWLEAVASDRGIGAEERNLLLSFGSSLGKSDIEGQIMSIESAVESIKDIEQQRIEDYHRKGKLYRSIGALFGLMIGIIVI